MKNNSKNTGQPPKTGDEIIDMYFLDVRCALLETAAFLDRVERTGGKKILKENPRLHKLFESLELIKTVKGNRTEEFLKLFSEDE